MAGEAGVHIYAEEIAFHVSREFLSVHCASGGQRKIRLPFQAERITEIFEGRVIAGNTDTFSDYDLMSLKEKQVAAKQTFVFLGSLANEYPAKQDAECDSTNS